MLTDKKVHYNGTSILNNENKNHYQKKNNDCQIMEAIEKDIAKDETVPVNNTNDVIFASFCR